ncbi:MAG: methionyl-tRNA formyltransferase [Clostridia bacterium]|nr:methionyl-tRNA formyltransferase [Clostridia bacterium]MBQ5743228.1 methionyl-tRNA formyltransferase [Clostridia bacterium]
MNILFMGTSPFAVESLAALQQAGIDVACVITQPDRPKGRGYKMTCTPVKEFALSQEYRVETPETLKDEAILPLLQEIDPDLIIVVAYGKILPKYVLNYPKLGCINVHGSLLPMYRGAAPVNHVIMDGQTETGVTTMYMDEGLDTGDMILKATTPISEEDTFGTLHDRLAKLGGELLVQTVELIADGTAPRTVQEGETCYASMITKETRKLDFSKSKTALHNQIRGLNPEPCAFAFCGGKNVKVLESEPVDGCWDGPVGTIVDKKHLVIKVADGGLRLKTVQPEGKKPMSGESFCAGNRHDLFE